MTWDDETKITIKVTTFPTGVRDFQLMWGLGSDGTRPVSSFDLISSDRASAWIEGLKNRHNGMAAMALPLALARLLVQNIERRGAHRHLMVEPLTVDDLQGNTFASNQPFARDLGAKQAQDWKLIIEEELLPTNSLLELAWAAVAALPMLPESFTDPDMGEFAKALYFYLVGQGEGSIDVNGADIRRRVLECFKTGFAQLNLPFQHRDARQIFRKLLAVSLRWTSTIGGEVATQLVQKHLAMAAAFTLNARLSSREESLLHLRYGASPGLGGINVGFLTGCGESLCDAINEYASAHALAGSDEAVARSEANLAKVLALTGAFLERRRLVRAEEKRGMRAARADKMPLGVRLQAQGEQDVKSVTPQKQLLSREEFDELLEVIPELKERDARKLMAYIDSGGDIEVAANALGIPPRNYRCQLRDTVFPAVKKAMLARRAALIEE